MREISKIIVHCSATPEGRAHTVQDIDKWHRQRGFSEIGYHYVIYLDGSLHNGRPIEKVGSHTLGENTGSIGVCYIGGLAQDGKTPKDTRTERQKQTLKELIAKLKAKYPRATVHGHNEFASKACPCFDVKSEF